MFPKGWLERIKEVNDLGIDEHPLNNNTYFTIVFCTGCAIALGCLWLVSTL